ncbi:type II toxin-antitoxin system RelE/ParE family toxin [Sphingobacteriales bacterium CHB3]|nr:type II toxin-antitoxin system RelE/ParE family toxin [Sphingobacteriales bacterium CHB3]
MIRAFSFNEEAERELAEAVEFYEEASSGLGTAFLDEVERAIASILRFPKANTLLSKTVRRKIVTRFPYSILYSSSSQEIRILAIANQKRRPFYWRSRR